MLKETRMKKGLSQSQLSNKAGINIRTLQEYERGTRDVNGMKLSSMLDLCLALECDLKDILTDNKLVKKIEEFRSNQK